MFVYSIVFIILILLLNLYKKKFHTCGGMSRIVILLFFFIIIWIFFTRYIGKDGGTPKLPVQRNIYFENTGVYSYSNEIIFKKNPGSKEFPLSYLGDNDFIRFSPLKHTGEKIETWLIEYYVNKLPLRIGRKAININNEQWFDYNDKLNIDFELNDKNYLLILERERKSSKEDLYIFSLTNFSIEDLSVPDIFCYTDTFSTVKDGISINRLFTSLMRQNPNYNRITEKIASKLDNAIFFFREIKDETSSKLCFLINENRHDIRIKKVSTGNKTIKLICGIEKTNTDTVSAEKIVNYGYGVDVISLNFSNKYLEINTVDGKQTPIAPIYYNYPEKFRLPEDTIKNFLITTWEGLVDFDYVFKSNLGDNALPVYAHAIFNESYDSLVLNTGKQFDNIALGQHFFLDNGETGRVHRFFKYEYRYHGITLFNMVSLILIICFLVMSFLVYPKSSKTHISNINLYWISVILIVLFLAIIKLILSYRVAAFPPEFANYKEIILLKKTIEISIKSLLLIPIIFFLPYYKSILNVQEAIQYQSTKNERFIVKYRKYLIFFSFLFLIYFLLGKTIPVIICAIIFLPIVGFKYIDILQYIHKIENKVTAFLNKKGNYISNIVFKWRYNFFIILIVLLNVSLGFFVDNTGAIFGFRFNIFSILSLFIIFYLFSKLLISRNLLLLLNKKNKKAHPLALYFAYLIIIGVVCASNFFLAKDKGFFLVYFPLFCLLPVFWYIWNDVNKIHMRIPFIVPILLYIGILLPEKYIPISPYEDSVYRLNATNPEYWYDLRRNSDIDFNETLFKNNTYQMWQLKNYAAHGGWKGKGYANTTFTNMGVTIPVSLTDSLFSIYILAEFGALGGIIIFIFFIMLLIFLVQIALRFKKDYYHLIWLIIGIGFYFLHTAIYMGIANIGYVHFTGQNIPFFSLSSLSDAIHFLLLILLVGILTLNHKHGYNEKAITYKQDGNKRSYRTLKTIIFIYLIFFFVPSIFLFAYNIKNSKKDFVLPDEIVGEFNRYVSNEYLKLRNDSLVQISTVEPLSIFFQNHINKFNSISKSDKRNPQYGLIFLDQNNIIRLNKYYYKASSPFNKKKPWKGIISAGDKDSTVYQLNFLDTTVNMGIVVDPTSMQTLSLSELNERKKFTSGCLKIIDNSKNGIVEINRNPIGVVLNVLKDNYIYVNGKMIQCGDSIYINEQDIVLLSANKLKYYFSFQIYNGNPISRLIWINGRHKRIYKYGDVFPFAFNIAEAANITGLENDEDIYLTINTNLQTDIQEVIKQYALSHKPYLINNNEIHKTSQIAFSVMDSYTGNVLAMGSWPNFNPNDDNLYKYFNKLTPLEESRVITNPNLRKHAIGSTFKPLTYAAMSLTFNPQNNFDIADFEVYHDRNSLNDEQQRNFNKINENNEQYFHPHLYLAGINLNKSGSEIKFWNCHDRRYGFINKDIFFKHSVNFYQLNLFALGLLQNDELKNIHKFFKSTNTSDLSRTKIRINHKIYYLDVHKSNIFDDEKNEVMKTSILPKSIVFNNIGKLFSVNLEHDINYNNYKSISNSWIHSLLGFLPVFTDKTNGYLKFVSPHPVCFDVNVLPSIDDLESLMRGGGQFNKWNNIHICEAFARISTGEYIESSLQPRNKYDYEQLPYPLSTDWRKNNLIKPLHLAAKEGTARNCFRNVNNKNIYYIAKTGTLQERNPKKESELLMFTIGEYNRENNKFVKGRTLTCYLYMEDSKYKAVHTFQRNEITPLLVDVLLKYLNP